ncbi:hypothetical protein Q6348_11330 [Isoptericola sp. b441]|uniref:Uncharacterized protein n=1 Tax=Actinotalea lenta TaxID=3064654 RepID=A0ABT9DA64_9CELL|nr:hypothetical protein [Isoptericola sp. b441]MDO8107789.1 hypothetical protein [Isoptericola sp. b441]
MRSTRAGGWVAGTIFLVIAIFAGTWFLAAQPRFDDATQTRDQAASIRVQNAKLKAQVAELKADFAKLDDYRAELATLRTQIPATAELSAYTRAVQALADKAGVTLTALDPATAQTVTPPAPPAPATPTPDPSASGDAGTTTADQPGSSGATATPADGTQSKPLDGMAAVPMSITVVGTYANATAFLQGLQTGTDRLFLPVSVDGSRQPQAVASGGRPATADGDLELTVDGWAYVLPPSQDYLTYEQSQGDATPAPDTTGTPTLPGSARNPFVPLPGT